MKKIRISLGIRLERERGLNDWRRDLDEFV